MSLMTHSAMKKRKSNMTLSWITLKALLKGVLRALMMHSSINKAVLLVHKISVALKIYLDVSVVALAVADNKNIVNKAIINNEAIEVKINMPL